MSILSSPDAIEVIKVREVKIVKGVIAGDIKRTRTKSTLLYKSLKWKVTLNKILLHLKEISHSGNKSTDHIKEIVCQFNVFLKS